MKMTKTIRFRVSDMLYEELYDLAEDENLTLSDLSRNLIQDVLDGNTDECVQDDPLNHSKFIYLIIWMYYQRVTPFTLGYRQIRGFKEILDSNIDKLEPVMKSLFIKVKNDLDRISNQVNEFTDASVQFGLYGDKNYFDFERFENYLINKK